MQTIKRKVLKKMYEKNLINDTCNILQISPPTLLKLVRSAGIKTKGRGNRTPRRKIAIDG